MRVVAVLVWLLVLAGAADAATFCVAKPACVADGGTAENDLPSALNAAAANPGRDRIELGAATIPYAGTAANDAANNQVDIVGAGRGTTILQATGTLLSMNEPTSTLSDVHVTASGSVTPALDVAAGALHRVDLDATQVSGPATVVGIHLGGGGAVLDDSVVTMATGQTNFAVRSDVTAAETAPVVRTLVANAATGVGLIGDGGLTLQTSDVHGRTVGVRATAGTITVDDTVVRAAGATGIAADVPSGASGGARVIARQVSVLLSAAGTGLEASSATAGQTGTVNASDTVVHGSGVAASGSSVAGSGTITLDYSAYAFGAVNAGPHTTISGQHDVDLTTASPGFLDEGAGDARLTASSPLIDAGDPGPTLGPAVDFAGLPRLRDGNGDGTTVADIGAFEYQHDAPTVSASATPTSAGTDQEIAFTATAADADAGETPLVTWTFDDGASATGASTSHSFATGGDHTATATATDPSGLTATSTVVVHVLADNAPPAPTHVGPVLFIRILRAKLDRRRTFLIGVFCPYTDRPRCTGTVSVRRGSRVLASTPLRVAAAGTQIVRLRVSRATAALAHRRRRLGVMATVVARNVLGDATTRTFKVTLRPFR